MKTRKEKQFYDNLTHFIGYRLHSSILHFCDEAVCLMGDGTWEASFDKPKVFRDEEKRLIEDLLNLDNILTLEEKDGKFEEINGRKQRLKEAAEYFERMKSALLLFSEAAEEILFDYTDTNTNYHNESYFAKCSGFLRFVEQKFDTGGSFDAVATVVSLMPMRMTKNKFYSYLEKSLRMLPPDMNGYALKVIAKAISVCVQPIEKHYEDIFPLYGDFCKIYDFWMTMPKIKDITPELKDTLKALLEEADALCEEISISVSLLESLYSMLNRLTVLLLGGRNPADLTNENIYLKDAYYTAVKICSEEGSAELFDEAYYDLSENAFDAIKDKEFLGEKIEDVVDSKSFETFSRETVLLYESLLHINNLISESLTSLPEKFGDEQPALGTAEFDEYVRGVVESVKEATQKYSAVVRKMKYRQIINSVFCPFDAGELHEYIKESYESSSPAQRSFTGHKLREVFWSFGFLEDYEWDIKGHDHEHDCDCEHIGEDLQK